MKKILTRLIATVFLFGCGNNSALRTASSTAKDSTSQVVKRDPIKYLAENWLDSAVIRFINKTDNELIKAVRTDHKIEWLYDRTEKTDSATYYAYQLGHTSEDHFVTDCWVYIDSVKRTIFEVDLTVDSIQLIKFRE